MASPGGAQHDSGNVTTCQSMAMWPLQAFDQHVNRKQTSTHGSSTDLAVLKTNSGTPANEVARRWLLGYLRSTADLHAGLIN